MLYGQAKFVLIQLMGVEPIRLDDILRAKGFLIDSAKQTGIKLIEEPRAYNIAQEMERRGEPATEKNLGVTGVVSLATSHISIHTFPSTASVIIDVLSYQEFAVAQIVDIAIRDYDPLRAELTDLSRHILEPTLG